MKTVTDDSSGGFRLRGTAAMFTYQGFSDTTQWLSFVNFVRERVGKWNIKHWCCTMEANTQQGYHIHVMLQFRKEVDRTSKSFAYNGINPRCDGNDLCGQGLCRKKLQESIDRGFF